MIVRVLSAMLLGLAGIAHSSESYRVLDEHLTALINDFNAHQGRVRQIYIVGPTCGICLRGMADMDAALVRDLQDDPRLQTLVLHVPAMGAEERHVQPTVHLLQGPRVEHYWDGSGRSGLQFQEALGLPVYAWDVWLVYGPEAYWEPGNPPPGPLFWQHQLGALGVEFGSKLDPELLAARVRAELERLNPAMIEEPPATASERGAEVGLIRVAQPRGYVIQQHLMTRGGYHRLKTLESKAATGSLQTGGQQFGLAVKTDSNGRYTRQIHTPSGVVTTTVADGKVHHDGQAPIPVEVDNAVLSAFEFSSWLMEWKDKGHQVWRLGMRRDDDRLPWIMELEHANGQVWHLYVDSHTGDIYRKVLLDGAGETSVVVEFEDFREVDGFRFPFQQRLFDAHRLIGTIRFSDIELTTAEPRADVAH